MRITSVKFMSVSVPYDAEVGPIVTAGLEMTHANHVLVRVDTDEGIAGWGEALQRPSVYGETIESIFAALTKLLAPPIIGLDPREPEKLWAKWVRVVGNTTAKAALDVACHDIAGRAAGAPIFKLLGGAADEPVVRLTMPVALAREEEVVRQAERAVERGFTSVKLKVGKDVARDVRVTQAVRSAIGGDIDLYVDANQAYTTSEAARAARGFEAADISLLEEPVAPGNTAGRVKLAETTSVPLLLDETIERPSDALREIKLGTAGAFSIRSPRTGITWSRKMAAIAEAAGVPCLVGSHRELGIATAASAHLAAGLAGMSLPAELGVYSLVTEGLVTEPLRIEDGALVVPDGPGLGVEVDEDAVDRFRTSETFEVAA
jgi:L-alanine-DL-glutamate epimerase-like enolase superfamily enzyme